MTQYPWAKPVSNIVGGWTLFLAIIALASLNGPASVGFNLYLAYFGMGVALVQTAFGTMQLVRLDRTSKLL